MSATLIEGTIERIIRGTFGYIKPTEGNSVYFGRKVIVDGKKKLFLIGQKVSFELGTDSENRPCATKVILGEIPEEVLQKYEERKKARKEKAVAKPAQPNNEGDKPESNEAVKAPKPKSGRTRRSQIPAPAAEPQSGEEATPTATEDVKPKAPKRKNLRQKRRPRRAAEFENGKNLNNLFRRFRNPAALYGYIMKITEKGGDFTVRNFVGVIENISVEKAVVETDLFPKGALEYYTKKNLGADYTEEEKKQWDDPQRGGEQGDYRDGMKEKIANVIECLKTEPQSKRAIIPIPFSSEGSKTVDWKNQGQTKCCRELHFYIEDGKLKCTGILRMQNAVIFPKNIHFFAHVIAEVAQALELPVGEYTHWITNLCHDRSATSC